jgi:hypothetical protein
MGTQDGHQVGQGVSWFRVVMLLAPVLGLLIAVWLVASCAPSIPVTAPTSTELVEASIDTPSPLPPTATEIPAPSTETSVPRMTDLKATVVAGLPATPTPDPAAGAVWGEVNVGVLPLVVGDDASPLWAAFSQGMGFYDPEQGHFVAIYAYGEGDWRELDRVVLTTCAEYVGSGSLTQVQLEPEHVWLEMQSGVGAHSGCYDLLSFDGQWLVEQASNWSASPGAGWLQDVDGDGTQEVVLDQTEYYVFCYACGVRLPSFRVLRWDGERLAQVELSPVPDAAPAELKRLNDGALEMAQAGLWADALEAITQARALGTQQTPWAEIVSWNEALIRLQAKALTDQLRDGQYPLLENVLYGDYAAAVDVMRAYSADEIWGPDTPLVKGTVAEGFELELSDWISRSANLALGVQPDLAPALFLRGWGAHLRSPDDAQALADVERAAALAPDDALFSKSATHLQGQGTMFLGPPEKMPGFEPLPPEICYELGQAMMHTLQVTVTLSQAPFEDYVQGTSGTGCQATAVGTGVDFESYSSVAASLNAMMDERGWREDQMYAAGGPTGTATAFRHNGDLCLLSTGWKPASDAQCPPDQPISACELAPEQQLYTIQLNCAQGGLSPVPVTDTPTPVPVTDTPTPVPLTDTPAPSTVVAPDAEERWEVRTLLAGPGEPGRLYALLVDESSGAWPATHVLLLISDDYGETWVPFPGGLPAEECVLNLNLDYAVPSDGGGLDALYASTCQGLFRWTGSEWEFLSPRETGMVAVVYGDPQIIWATEAFGQGGGVIRSDDGGRTWQPAGSGLISFNGVANIAIDPRDANTLYGIIWPKYAGSYLRRGTASGRWQTMPTPQNNSVIDTGMAIDGANGALYVMVTSPNAQLWRTQNPHAPDLNDVHWGLVHDFGRDVSVELLASGWGPEGLALYANVWPLVWKDANLALVGEPALHRSLDSGQTWTELPIP